VTCIWRLEPADEFDPGCVQEQRTVAFFTEEHARETLALCILASTAEEARTEVLYERCCGIDVHKSSVAACILLEQGHKLQKHLRRFGCTTRNLLELADWLRSFEVRPVAMESTGVYWKPVWNVLEEHFHMVLANAQHIKAVPGRKTDMMDCQWIREIAQSRVRYGYRKIRVLLNREGWDVGKYLVYKEEGLALKKRSQRKRKAVRHREEGFIATARPTRHGASTSWSISCKMASASGP